MTVRDKSRQNKRNNKQVVEQANMEAIAKWIEPIPFNRESSTNTNTQEDTDMTKQVQIEPQPEVTQTTSDLETTNEDKTTNLNQVHDKWVVLGEKLKDMDWANAPGEKLVSEFNLPATMPMATIQVAVGVFPATIQPLIKQGVMTALDEESQTVSVAKLIDLVKPWLPLIMQGLQEQLVSWLTEKVTTFLINTLSKVDFTVFMPAPQAATTVTTTASEDEDAPTVQFSPEVVYDLSTGMKVLVIMDKYFLNIKGSKRYTELKEGLYQLKYSKGW